MKRERERERERKRNSEKLRMEEGRRWNYWDTHRTKCASVEEAPSCEKERRQVGKDQVTIPTNLLKKKLARGREKFDGYTKAGREKRRGRE